MNIYINEKDPEARRRRSFKHEVIHSAEDDFYSAESEDTIERRTRLLEKSTTIYVRNWGVWVKRSEGA